MDNNSSSGRSPGSLWHRLLDGMNPWGSFLVQPGRYGSTRYQIVVYPPGSTAAQRRRIRLWRGWPLWGALLWLICIIALPRLIDQHTAFVVSTVGCLAAGALVFIRAGDLRTGTRTLNTTVLDTGLDVTARTTCRRIKSLAATMARADDQLAAGVISPADYEAIWWQVYQGMSVDITHAASPIQSTESR